MSRLISKLIFIIFSTFIIIGSSILTNCSDPDIHTDSKEFYQLKFITISSDSQSIMLDEYLENAYLPALHRSGIPKVGVFKPVEYDTRYKKLIIVWIPFNSMNQFVELENKLNGDAQYLSAAVNYIRAPHDNPPFERMESILLSAFSEMPLFGKFEYSTLNSERVYELRSYQAATENLLDLKVEMFNEGGEVKIFKDLGFNPLFFGEVISGSEMPNLMYMSTFENKDSQSEHWNAFRTSPEWEKLKNVARYDNTVSHIDKYLLYPTDYSDL